MRAALTRERGHLLILRAWAKMLIEADADVCITPREGPGEHPFTH
jgi:hypothetical protein